MRLTRLEISGFKSFGERTVLTFQPGITAVVGPNGCGKSNIADAILWCLGEQSPKTLRGDRMEDVLFNGSAGRAPTGLAEVALTFGGVRRGDLEGVAGEYSELTVSRRLYRSGESDYLINRVPCRLKDIRDVLIETGAGIKGHTVLEQGKVDAIINASPLERRALVEETAGIIKYKIRKTEALRKLEATDQNLLRVRDIIGEVKRQLASLDRQAKKAERYRQTFDQLRALDLRAAAARYQDWRAQVGELSVALDRDRAEEARLLADLGAMDAKITEEKVALADLDRQFQDVQGRLVEQETGVQHSRHRLDFLAAQTEEWRGQSQALAAEQEVLARSLAERRTDRIRCDADYEAVEAALQEHLVRLEEREAAVDALDQRVAQSAADIEQTRHRVFDALSGVTMATNTLATLAMRREELAKRRARYQEDIHATGSEIVQRRAAQQELEAAHQLDARSLAARDAERTALRDASGTRQAALQEGEAVLTARRDALTRLRATLDSLLALQRDLVGYDEGVRHLLHGGDPATSPAGLLGVVADLLDIPAPYERAIEAVLADRLQGVVAEGHGPVEAAVSVLDTHNAGRATFVPRTLRVNPSPAGDFHQRHGIHGRARDLVGCQEGFEALRDALLDGVIIVIDRQTARQCWEDDRHGLTWVAASGDVFFPSGVVSGGAGPRVGLGLLERKRAIKTLELDAADAEAALAPIESSVVELRQALDADRLILARMEEDLREGELRLVHDYKAAQAIAQEVLQLERRVELLVSEEESAGHDLDAIASAALDSQAALAACEAAKTQEEQVLLAQNEAAARLKASLAESVAAVTESRLELATHREKREHVAAARQALSQRIDELARQIAAKEAARDHLERRITAALQERDEVTEALRIAETGVHDLKRQVTALGAARTELAHRIRELEDSGRVRRRDLDGLQARLQSLSVSLAEMRMRVTQQAGEVLDRYQTDLETVSIESLPPLPCGPDEVDTVIARLKETLAQLGSVNLAAIDEYRELEERHAFLAAQETDLTQSVANLHAAITKINDTTRELFLEAFHALNTKFGSVYTSFFEGGHAELRLADDNPLECGIEIVAQPPGKKLRHISLLSGGEKALTAIALLFSSFLIHPSPFCVLDEIDAPLDEENVRRFTRALRMMTAHSQFLVVTHNRRTMEQADVLYGVTMEEPGVSKLVSVKLQMERADPSIEVETAEVSL